MTLQEILRAKDKCGGCKHQVRNGYVGLCKTCIVTNGWTGLGNSDDNYELEELERLAEIGADLEYVSNIKWIGNIPSVAHVQELAKIWREREGETNEDMV